MAVGDINYVCVRIANIVLGFACIFLQVYVCAYSEFSEAIDKIFLIVVVFCFFEATLLIVIVRGDYGLELIWRLFCGVALLIVSALLLNSTFRIQLFCDQSRIVSCQQYGPKIAAAVLAVINGILYPFAKYQRLNMESDLENHRSSPAAPSIALPTPPSSPPEIPAHQNTHNHATTNHSNNIGIQSQSQTGTRAQNIIYPWGYPHQHFFRHPCPNPSAYLPNPRYGRIPSNYGACNPLGNMTRTEFIYNYKCQYY